MFLGVVVRGFAAEVYFPAFVLMVTLRAIGAVDKIAHVHGFYQLWRRESSHAKSTRVKELAGPAAKNISTSGMPIIIQPSKLISIPKMSQACEARKALGVMPMIMLITPIEAQ
jgi:hypothetical protein